MPPYGRGIVNSIKKWRGKENGSRRDDKRQHTKLQIVHIQRLVYVLNQIYAKLCKIYSLDCRYIGILSVQA